MMRSENGRRLSRREVDRTVREVIAAVLPTAQVLGDRHLRDLGADSVDRIEIITGAMARLGVCEPMESFADLPDVDALVRFLHRVTRR